MHLNHARPCRTVIVLVALAFSIMRATGAMSAEMTSLSPEPIWARGVKVKGGTPGHITILGAKKDGKFTPTSVIMPEKPGTPVPTVSLPLNANLVPGFGFRSFGAEERVTIKRRKGALSVRCSAGRKSAGALFSSAGFHFPRGLEGRMIIEGRGSGKFQVAIKEKGQEAKGFVPLSAGQQDTIYTIIPSSAWTGLKLPEELIILCPDAASEVSITRIEIEPTPRQVGRPDGTWIWNVTRWLDRGEELVSQLKRLDIGEVFIQVQISKGTILQQDDLVRLIEDLSVAGIRVNTVEGDGSMAGPEGRAIALERARLLRGLKVGTDGKLLTYQYDIEPYVLPAFESDPTFWWTGWGQTLTELATTLEEPVSAVVPFWLLRQPAAVEAILRARKSLARIVVMSYRTTAPEIEEIAEEWLDWGRSNGVPVAFALENGFVPTEYARYYLRAESGNLLLDLSGNSPRVLLFNATVLGTSKRLAYSFDRESKIESARISFLNDREKLKKNRERLQSNLSAWEAFDGLLVHEIVP